MKIKFFIYAVLFLMLSCSKRDSVVSIIDSTLLKIKSDLFLNSGLNAYNFDSFKINIQDLKLRFDVIGGITEEEFVGYDGNGFFDKLDNSLLNGPIEIEFFSDQDVLNLPSPKTNYNAFSFQFTKSEDTDSEMYNKTIRLEGRKDGMPIVFWHDFEDVFAFDFDDEGFVINESVERLKIRVFLGDFLSVSLLSNALDGDGDGTITISPNDTDGNNDLAETIKDLFLLQLRIVTE
ncbi:hypothetical protein [uncultured Psychroserpens sp.]|uniref:hypothetical protein n=1 Tax=uncultured Psychroserpens sp. TaxID=255436 RepID=UPI00261DC7D1|nr:hypothetical protein [uncultured Psychroserpens sp.]